MTRFSSGTLRFAGRQSRLTDRAIHRANRGRMSLNTERRHFFSIYRNREYMVHFTLLSYVPTLFGHLARVYIVAKFYFGTRVKELTAVKT